MKNFAFLLLAAGCTSGTTSDVVSEAVTAATTTHSAAKSCFDDFQTCINGASVDADVTACQDALKACLPAQSGIATAPPPDLCSDEPPHSCDGGMRPPPQGPPPSPGPGGGPPPGGPPPQGGPGFPVSPETHVALATCHAELKKCLDAGGDQKSCVDADHQCVHDALSADFTALCASLGDACASCPDSPRCTDLAKRCADGVSFAN